MSHSGLAVFAGLLLAFPAILTASQEPVAKAGILTPQEQSQAAYQRGLEFSRAGDDDKAVTEFERAVEFDPKSFDAYKGLDDILSKRGQWAVIIEYWTRYIAQAPDDGRAYCERGGAYSRLADVASELRDADKACSLGNQKCCQIAANYRRVHGVAASPSPVEKPWWRNRNLYTTLAKMSVLIVPIVAAILYWIFSALRESRPPKPALSSVPSLAAPERQPTPERMGPPRLPEGVSPASAGYEGGVAEVKFTLTVGDVLELQNFNLRKTRKKQFAIVLGNVAIGFATAFVMGRLLHQSSVQSLIIACVALAFLIPAMSLERKRKRMAKARALTVTNPALFSEITLTINAEGFSMKNAAEVAPFAWRAVQDVVENKPYIYLFMGPASTMMIPERGFKSPGEARHFLELANSFWKSAKASLQSKKPE